MQLSYRATTKNVKVCSGLPEFQLDRCSEKYRTTARLICETPIESQKWNWHSQKAGGAESDSTSPAGHMFGGVPVTHYDCMIIYEPKMTAANTYTSLLSSNTFEKSSSVWSSATHQMTTNMPLQCRWTPGRLAPACLHAGWMWLQGLVFGFWHQANMTSEPAW